MRYVHALVIGLIAFGCQRTQYSETTRYHEDGRAKPVVAVASMIDTSSFDAPWSLSEELTSMIVRQIASSGQIYVKEQEDFSSSENPFGNDLSWMKREFSSNEFVVFLELVEHGAVPASKQKKNLPPQEISTYLNMGVRLRVIDLRAATPKIVLQEMVRDNYFIPKTLLPTDYSVITWGTEEYKKSPMGIAHAQLVQDICSRVHDYILLAKSR